MKNSYVIYLLLICFACNTKTNKNTENIQENDSVDVFIIYSSGSPYKSISDMGTDEIDAITNPTPTDMNCKIFSHLIAKKIKENNRSVALKNVDEIKSAKQIMRCRTLIIGSPSYFHNVDWKMKRMFDIFFEDIYVAYKKEFSKKQFFAFAMAETKSSAKETLQNGIIPAIGDCYGHIDSSYIFTTNMSREEYDAIITDIVQRIRK